jgi:hypothetical protein
MSSPVANRFLVSHNGTHPREMAEMDVNRFLTHLAASTQNQALAAVLFLYGHVLGRSFAEREHRDHEMAGSNKALQPSLPRRSGSKGKATKTARG